jgi:hypothetical protein
VVILVALLTVALLASGPARRPVFDWGARPAAIVSAAPAPAPLEAFVTEVHAAPVGDGLVVRFTFDRPVRAAMRLANGKPVSGRLRAVLYWDLDDDVQTGLDVGRSDLRTGAERKLEIGVVSVGEDLDEKRPAQALVVAALYGLTRDFRQEVLWRTDGDASPPALSWRGEWLEVRLPGRAFGSVLGGRMVLAPPGGASVGRVAPFSER